ncbi:Pleiotropic drug resistance protein 3, partial [Globisporangium splendens]
MTNGGDVGAAAASAAVEGAPPTPSGGVAKAVATHARRNGLRAALAVIFFFGFVSLVLTARSTSFSAAWGTSFRNAATVATSTSSGMLRKTTRTVVPLLVDSESQFDSNASAALEPSTTMSVLSAAEELRAQPEIRPEHALPSRPKYALLRTIGNALPPRHDPARTLQNLRFILEHERLDDDEIVKHWVINRIIDPTLLEQLKALLREFNAEFTEIPFVLHEYAQQPFRVVIEDQGIDRVHAAEVPEEGESEWIRVLNQNEIYDFKNRYALSVNAARNVMLAIGRRMGARWILPWDQNSFLTQDAWRLIKTDLSYNDHLAAQSAGQEGAHQLKYFLSYMDRLVEENDVILSPSYTPNAWAEPQLIFRDDAREQFDERFRYGKRDKVALLVRLNVRGVWNEWGWSWWEQQRTFMNISSDVYGVTVPQTGYVVRLYSGVASFETNDKGAAYWRELKRGEGVVHVLERLEKRVMREAFQFSNKTLSVYSESKLAATRSNTSGAEVRALVEDAERAMRVQEPWTVTSNAVLSVFNASQMFANYVDKPDATDDGALIKHMVYNTTSLALAWQITRDSRYAAAALKFVEAWCGDSNVSTAMLPLLDFADLSFEGTQSGNSQYWTGSASGIRHTVILPMLLDTMRMLLFHTPELSTAVDERITSFRVPDATKTQLIAWVQELYTHLKTSVHARTLFHASTSLYGLQYDLQVAAMAAFLDDPLGYRYTLGTMQGRLLTMLDMAGNLVIPIGVAKQPYMLLSLAIWGLALDVAQQLNMTSHLLHFDMTSDGGEETTSNNGLLCRMVERQIPCCERPTNEDTGGNRMSATAEAEGGRCVKLLQDARPVQLFIYQRIVRHAISECAALKSLTSCTTVATMDISSETLSAEELSHYQLPPYHFLRQAL